MIDKFGMPMVDVLTNEQLITKIKLLTAERDAYREEWNGGLLTTPRSAIEAENVRLRAALKNLVDSSSVSRANFLTDWDAANEALKGD